MPRSISATLGLREGESARTVRLVGFVFLLTAAAVLARSAQREIFLAAYPRSAISEAFLYSAAVLGLSSLGISALALRLSLVRLSQVLIGTGAALMVGGRVLLTVWPSVAPMTLYVVVEVTVSLVLAQGWAVVAEAVDVRAAKRLFPVIGLGAGLAWTVGGFAVGALAKVLGPGLILSLAPAALVGSLFVLQRLSRAELAEARRAAPKADTGFLEGLGSGFKALWNEPLLRVLAVIISVETVVERVTDLQLLASAQARFAGQSGGISAFMGLFYGVTGAVTLVAPLVTGRVLSRFGSTRALLAGQLFVLAASAAFFTFPLFGVVVLLAGGDRIFKQTLGGPARSQVMGALPTARRMQAGALLRGVVAAAFAALAAVGLKAAPQTMPVHWYAAASVVLLLALLEVTRRGLRRAYLHALQQSVDQSRLDLSEGGERQQLDGEQLVTLAEELEGKDEVRASLAVSLLGAAEPATARPLLRRALGHPSADVRAQAVAALGRAGAPEDAAAVLETLSAAGEDVVRCACFRALADLRAVGALPALLPHADAAAPRVRALARVCRVRLLELKGQREDADAVSGPLEEMMTSQEPLEREAAAWAVGQIPLADAEVRLRLAPMLADADVQVRRAAVAASGRFDDEPIVRALVLALEEPATASAAFDAFSQMEDGGVDRVARILSDAPPAVVSRTASALSRGQASRATDVLNQLLDHQDAQVRYRASRALVLRRRVQGWKPPPEAAVLRAIETELAQGYRYHATLAALARELAEGDAEHRFVRGELDSRIRETERRLLSLVAVVADARIARLAPHLRDASRQVAARVLELVEESLEQRLSELVVPFLEQQASEKKVELGVRRFKVPSAFGQDAVGALLQLGDPHLRRVARLAFRERAAAHLQGVEEEEADVLRMVERLRFLRGVPVFKNLSPEDLMKLAEIASRATHQKGKAIFKKGDPGDVLCVVVTGRVEIRDKAQVIATQGPNDFFGELALFDQEPRSADAVCVEDTELLEIGGADLDSLMERRPEIAREIIRVLAKRLRKTTQELVGKASSTPSGEVPVVGGGAGGRG